jgi:hypothetical protein
MFQAAHTVMRCPPARRRLLLMAAADSCSSRKGLLLPPSMHCSTHRMHDEPVPAQHWAISPLYSCASSSILTHFNASECKHAVMMHLLFHGTDERCQPDNLHVQNKILHILQILHILRIFAYQFLNVTADKWASITTSMRRCTYRAMAEAKRLSATVTQSPIRS